MNIIISILIFCVVLFIYIHIFYHYKKSNDLEIFEVENTSKERLEELCDLRQPLLFNIETSNFNNLKQDNLVNLYGSFDVKVRNTKNTDYNSELFLPVLLKDALKLINDDKEEKYIIENNDDFLIETTTKKILSINDEYLRPYMMASFDYDYLCGSLNSSTPLRYEINYRNYLVVLEGKIKIKLTPPKSEKYLYGTKDYDNFEFRSPLNVWNIQEEYKNNFDKVKFLEITLEVGQIIYIPAYWWYSVKYVDKKTTVLSAKYRTYMNTVAILPELILKMMQKQNIKHEIIKGRN